MPTKIYSFGSRAGKILRAGFLCAIAAFVCADAFGVSERRKLVGRVAPSPAMKQYLANLPQVDIDLYVGKIVRKDGEYVIVNVLSPSTARDRIPIYYACDAKMRPTAMLESVGISHRACVAFKTLSGKALVGDTVMVKYPAHKKSIKKVVGE